MLQSILVPLDGSPLAEGVLPHVVELARREQATVHLLRVIPDPRPGVEDEAAMAWQALGATAERLVAAGVRAQAHVIRGDPAGAILAAAADRGAGLIAMSSHGRTGVLRWIRGSVAERVLREATTPLLVVTPRTAGAGQHLRRILVPLDGTERSAAVLPLVEALARAHGADVLLVRTEWDPVRRPVLAMALSPEKVAETLAPHRRRLEEAGLRVRAFGAHGDAASEVCDAAEREDVDLVAMTTHGRAGAARLLEGSVAETVLRHCRRPVLVVRCPEA